jgi:hypothetical protein
MRFVFEFYTIINNLTKYFNYRGSNTQEKKSQIIPLIEVAGKLIIDAVFIAAANAKRLSLSRPLIQTLTNQHLV